MTRLLIPTIILTVIPTAASAQTDYNSPYQDSAAAYNDAYYQGAYVDDYDDGYQSSGDIDYHAPDADYVWVDGHVLPEVTIKI